MSFRNIAIIAHVDHGKTTLVDHLLKQSGMYRENESVEERLMDSMDLEKERGITISAKNASFVYRDTKVNIVDTPGHSDFGGEVERILDMVDGAVLLVDSSEGPLPQTRFVLKKALEQDKKLLVCINKVDRKDARPDEVLDEIFDLFIDLGAREDQADFDVIYAIGRDGKASMELDKVESTDSLKTMMDLIIDEVPPPKVEVDSPARLLVTNIDYNPFVGRLSVGRLQSGRLKTGEPMLVHQEDGVKKMKITSLQTYVRDGLENVDEVQAGDIAVISGFEKIQIGDSICANEDAPAFERFQVDEPTVGIFLSVNNSPLAGTEGSAVTSRKISERLDKELLRNVSIKVNPTDSPETFQILARGELQIAVLLEQMRREGFEMLVSQPQVLIKEENGKKLEPYDRVYVDVDEEYLGTVTRKLQERKAQLLEMNSRGGGRSQATYRIPARGLIGYRSEFLTDTRGTGLMNSQFDAYDEHKGEISKRYNGRIISDRSGKATPYSLNNLEDRGKMFINPGTKVYKGMIIGEYNKGNELNVNVCREKKLTNVRASGTDDNVKLATVKPLNIESALEWIVHDEWIEITPKSIRLRLKVIK